MVEFAVKQLHLAAYIKAHGAEFVGFKDREFIFRSEKSADDWRVQHTNSCCRKVDMHLIDLRKYLKQ